jgi:hypothetical protein
MVSDCRVDLSHILIACIDLDLRAGLHCVPRQLGGEDGEAGAAERSPGGGAVVLASPWGT